MLPDTLRYQQNRMLTSTVNKKVSAVITGKMYKLSGVERSVNQYAPPDLNDSIFSAIVEIWGKRQVIIYNSKCNICNSKTKPVMFKESMLLSYSQEKADKDGTLNKNPFQRSKWSHAISVII